MSTRRTGADAGGARRASRRWRAVAAAQRRAGWVPLGRAVHLLDLENLCFQDPVTDDVPTAVAAVAAYRRAVPYGVHDHVVVAVHPAMALRARLVLPGAPLVVDHGIGGAADALQRAAIDAADIARRFDHLVVGSGSHRLAAFVAEVRALGVLTTVVAHEAGLSRELERAADRIVLIDAAAGQAYDRPSPARVR